MTTRDKEIECGLHAICDALTNASTCYDVWREMQDGTKRLIYEPVVQLYPIFFETTVVAHLIAMSTLLYSILETRRDTHNIPGLIRAMRMVENDANVLADISDRTEKLRPIWSRVSRVRNEVFGHSSKEQSPVQVFSEIQLFPEEIDCLIKELKDIIGCLANLAGVSVPHAFAISATEDTANLMRALVPEKTAT